MPPSPPKALNKFVGDRFRGRHAVKGHVRHVVRIEIPGMEIVRLVPLGDHKAAGLLHFLDDDARIGRVVGIDIDDELAAGALQQRLDIGNALLGVAFGDQRLIFGADRLGEVLAALGEGRMIGIGERAH